MMQKVIEGMALGDIVFKAVMLASYVMTNKNKRWWDVEIVQTIWTEEQLVELLYCREIPLSAEML